VAIMELGEICIDTNVLIAFLKGRDPAATALEWIVRNTQVFVTAITAYELLFGVARANRRIGEDQLLEVMAILPFDAPSAARAATLHDALIRSNQDIGVKDVMIAAICQQHDLPLLTLNERHFNRVEGLTILTPEQILQLLDSRSSLQSD